MFARLYLVNSITTSPTMSAADSKCQPALSISESISPQIFEKEGAPAPPSSPRLYYLLPQAINNSVQNSPQTTTPPNSPRDTLLPVAIPVAEPIAVDSTPSDNWLDWMKEENKNFLDLPEDEDECDIPDIRGFDDFENFDGFDDDLRDPDDESENSDDTHSLDLSDDEDAYRIHDIRGLNDSDDESESSEDESENSDDEPTMSAAGISPQTSEKEAAIAPSNSQCVYIVTDFKMSKTNRHKSYDYASKTANVQIMPSIKEAPPSVQIPVSKPIAVDSTPSDHWLAWMNHSDQEIVKKKSDHDETKYRPADNNPFLEALYMVQSEMREEMMKFEEPYYSDDFDDFDDFDNFDDSDASGDSVDRRRVVHLGDFLP